VVQSAVCVVQSAVCVVQSAVCVIQSAVRVVQSAVRVVQSAVRVIQSAMCVVQSAVCVVQSAASNYDTVSSACGHNQLHVQCSCRDLAWQKANSRGGAPSSTGAAAYDSTSAAVKLFLSRICSLSRALWQPAQRISGGRQICLWQPLQGLKHAAALRGLCSVSLSLLGFAPHYFDH